MSRVSDLPDDRRDVDDAAGSLLCSKLEKGLRAVEDSTKVGVDDGLPLIGFHSHDKTIAGDSSVVDQDIDGSKGLDGFGKEFLDRIGIGGFVVERSKVDYLRNSLHIKN